jgi:hypothetical protein
MRGIGWLPHLDGLDFVAHGVVSGHLRVGALRVKAPTPKFGAFRCSRLRFELKFD